MAQVKRFIVVAWCMLLVACGQGAREQIAAEPAAPPQLSSEAEPLPELDAQSPDAVIRSYWALQDWAPKNYPKELRLHIGPTLQKYFDTRIELSGGEFRTAAEQEAAAARDPFAPKPTDIPRVLQRDILEVKNESETRAIVLTKIKNITPIPTGFQLEEYARKARDYGEDVKYVVEKVNGKWRLTQAWYRDDFLMKDWTKAWEFKPPSPGPSSFNFYDVDH
jgi:hypothetical protein